MGFNLFGSIKDFFGNKVPNFFKNTVPQAFNKFGGQLGQGLSQAGGRIGGWANTLGGGMKLIGNVPILGDIFKNSPLGQIANTAIDTMSKGGNLLGQLGKGDLGGAVSSGIGIGGNVAKMSPYLATL